MSATPQLQIRYADVGGDRVAYQVFGDGPRDLVSTSGQWGHIDLEWEDPAIARFLRRLASFSRLIRFNARGSGLSDARPRDGREAWQHWAEDLLAVMDAVHSRTAAVFGHIDAGPLALQFAATHPTRISGLVLMNTTARYAAAPDYPQGHPPEDLEQFVEFSRRHWGTEKWSRASNPSLAGDPRTLRWSAKWYRAMGSPREVAESFQNQLKMDARPALSSIRTPVLVLTRTNYRWNLPPQGRYVADRVAGARFVELPGADSLPFWETPDLILDHIEEFMTGQRHGGEPDRALAALLFTDIVDSTKRAAALGDAAWRALLDHHDKILREQVGLFGGTLADHAGDGSLSTFENPRRAIECALTLRSALADIGTHVRTGVHFGEVERRTDGGISGVSVHVGARVMAMAGGGEVLVSRTVRDILIGSRYEFEDRGEHELRGVPGRWPLYVVRD